MTILAINLGKGKSVFCLFDTVTGEVEFGSVASSSRSLRSLVERLRPDRVAVEICPLAGRVYDIAQNLDVSIQVADTTQDAWKWKNVKRKTDEDDALKLARLCALDQLNLVHMPAPAMRQWRRPPGPGQLVGQPTPAGAACQQHRRWGRPARQVLAQRSAIAVFEALPPDDPLLRVPGRDLAEGAMAVHSDPCYALVRSHGGLLVQLPTGQHNCPAGGSLSWDYKRAGNRRCDQPYAS